MISTHCWVLYLKTNSYFESNHNIFKIRVQPTTKLIEISMQLGMKTITLIKFSTTCKTSGNSHCTY